MFTYLELKLLCTCKLSKKKVIIHYALQNFIDFSYAEQNAYWHFSKRKSEIFL